VGEEFHAPADHAQVLPGLNLIDDAHRNHIVTTDPIHLASALLFQEARRAAVVFATHDGQQATAARALGLECVGV